MDVTSTETYNTIQIVKKYLVNSTRNTNQFKLDNSSHQ